MSQHHSKAIANLSEELGQLHPEHPLQTLLIASLKDNDGRAETSLELAKQYAAEKHETLYLDSNATIDSNTAHTSRGFVPLVQKLSQTNLFDGKILDFGFNDLLHILRIQQKTGTLIINPDSQYQMCKLHFSHGEIFNVETPNRNALEQPSLQNILPDDVLDALNIHSETPILVQLLKLINPNDNQLKQFFLVDLANQLDVVREQAQSFEFKEEPQEQGIRIQKWLQHNTLIENLQIEDAGYISNAINLHSTELGTRLTRMPVDQKKANLLLDSDRYLAVSHMLKILEDQFDKIIIENPIQNQISSFAKLAKMADGTVMVIKRNTVQTRKAKKVIRTLVEHEVNVLGAVYNQA